MKHNRRWLAGLMAAVISAAIPWSCAAPAEFRIDASGRDVVEQEIAVDLYRRADGQFQADGTRQYSCRLNRATRDASFFIQTDADGVWVTVDYLTDVNGDGVYEMLVDENTPVWDVMDAQGGLAPQQGGEAGRLAGDQTYILSAELLLVRSQQAVKDRVSGGASPLDVGQGGAARQQAALCMIQIHHAEDSTQTYYLQIYGNVLIPTDISLSDGYYDAVEYALEQGYFAGTDSGLFLPDKELSRAELAQVLWTMGGCQQAPAAQFFDVPSSEWYYQAVAWCKQEGMIAGYTSYLFAPGDPLSWEQMVTILHRYAQRSGSNMRANADLSGFSDAGDISGWALESMRWAVTHQLISGTAGMLRPGDPVTRAELASVLYAYEMNLSLYR